MSKNKHKHMEVAVPQATEAVEVPQATEATEKKLPGHVCKYFRKLAIDGAKDRKELAEKILKAMKDDGVSKYKLGKNKGEISVASIMKQIGGLRQNIVHKTGGWKNNYSWVEDDKQIKIEEIKSVPQQVAETKVETPQ